MKKIAIIGKNSYIGDSFFSYCHNDFEIDIIDSMNEEWKKTDLSQYDTVFHVAGIAHVSADPKMEQLYYKVNRDLAIEVCNVCKEFGVKQFVFMSSMIIYGKDGKVGKKNVITRDTPYSPIDFYGKSKLDADIAIGQMADSQYKTVVIRTPIVYGPNCKGNFPKLMSAAKKMSIFPRIKNERSMIYIDNLLVFIKLAIENDSNGVFYPQNAEYVSTSEVVMKMRKIYGKKMWCTRLLFLPLWILSRMTSKVNKVFGNKVYDKSLSITFDNKYNIINFDESLKRMAGVNHEQ